MRPPLEAYPLDFQALVWIRRKMEGGRLLLDRVVRREKLKRGMVVAQQRVFHAERHAEGDALVPLFAGGMEGEDVGAASVIASTAAEGSAAAASASPVPPPNTAGGGPYPPATLAFLAELAADGDVAAAAALRALQPVEGDTGEGEARIRRDTQKRSRHYTAPAYESAFPPSSAVVGGAAAAPPPPYISAGSVSSSGGSDTRLRFKIALVPGIGAIACLRGTAFEQRAAAPAVDSGGASPQGEGAGGGVRLSGRSGQAPSRYSHQPEEDHPHVRKHKVARPSGANDTDYQYGAQPHPDYQGDHDASVTAKGSAPQQPAKRKQLQLQHAQAGESEAETDFGGGGSRYDPGSAPHDYYTVVATNFAALLRRRAAAPAVAAPLDFQSTLLRAAAVDEGLRGALLEAAAYPSDEVLEEEGEGGSGGIAAVEAASATLAPAAASSASSSFAGASASSLTEAGGAAVSSAAAAASRVLLDVRLSAMFAVIMLHDRASRKGEANPDNVVKSGYFAARRYQQLRRHADANSAAAAGNATAPLLLPPRPPPPPPSDEPQFAADFLLHPPPPPLAAVSLQLGYFAARRHKQLRRHEDASSAAAAGNVTAPLTLPPRPPPPPPSDEPQFAANFLLHPPPPPPAAVYAAVVAQRDGSGDDGGSAAPLRPLDLTEVRRRIQRRLYPSADAFAADVRRVVAAALAAYSPGSVECSNATAVRACLARVMAETSVLASVAGVGEAAAASTKGDDYDGEEEKAAEGGVVAATARLLPLLPPHLISTLLKSAVMGPVGLALLKRQRLPLPPHVGVLAAATTLIGAAGAAASTGMTVGGTDHEGSSGSKRKRLAAAQAASAALPTLPSTSNSGSSSRRPTGTSSLLPAAALAAPAPVFAAAASAQAALPPPPPAFEAPVGRCTGALCAADFSVAELGPQVALPQPLPDSAQPADLGTAAAQTWRHFAWYCPGCTHSPSTAPLFAGQRVHVFHHESLEWLPCTVASWEPVSGWHLLVCDPDGPLPGEWEYVDLAGTYARFGGGGAVAVPSTMPGGLELEDVRQMLHPLSD